MLFESPVRCFYVSEHCRSVNGLRIPTPKRNIGYGAGSNANRVPFVNRQTESPIISNVVMQMLLRYVAEANHFRYDKLAVKQRLFSVVGKRDRNASLSVRGVRYPAVLQDAHQGMNVALIILWIGVANEMKQFV